MSIINSLRQRLRLRGILYHLSLYHNLYNIYTYIHFFPCLYIFILYIDIIYEDLYTISARMGCCDYIDI